MKAGKAIKIVEITVQANVENANQDAQHRDKTVRVRTKLCPDLLNIDATMIKFREWLATFKSYFYGSNLQNDISGQQAIFKQLLDPNLQRHVADTPVFNPDPNSNNVSS